jgi:hypothetical protein
MRAVQDHNLPWDPSIIALLPTPSAFDVMAGERGRTEELGLGNAVLADRAAVMDKTFRTSGRRPGTKGICVPAHGGLTAANDRA